MSDKISAMRREYLLGGLNRDQLSADPVEQLQLWFRQACDVGLQDPSAMTLATVNSDGQPSQRIVLMKQLDAAGIVFFTNLGSQKALDIAANPGVSAHFAWLPLERQVKVEGSASRLSTAESLKYFLSRPKESQLAAWASHQSRPIASRLLLEEQFQRMKNRFRAGEVPLPSFWGGYRIVPGRIEFWQGRASRLHDRFVYEPLNGGWEINRLEP